MTSSADADADRRHPRQPFRPELFASFAGGRSIVAVRELSGGRVNTSFAVDLDDGTRVVARQYARGSPAADAHIIGIAAEVVPVPDVLAYGDDWAVMRWVAGDLLRDRPEGLTDAARCLARLSTIQFERPGQLTPEGIVPWDFGDARSVNEYFLRDRRVQAALGEELVAAVRELEVREAGRFAELSSHHVLVHGDYNATNVLIEDGAVSGVLDWEFAMSGSAYSDIGNFRRRLGSEVDDLIEAGFRAEGVELDSDWRRLSELADLSSALEFLTTERTPEFRGRCIEQLRRTVAA